MNEVKKFVRIKTPKLYNKILSTETLERSGIVLILNWWSLLGFLFGLIVFWDLIFIKDK
jgi:hypothetical protein